MVPNVVANRRAKGRRSRLKHVRLSRVLGPTVLDVGPELTLA
jgi:hypothetical protein